jgi:hypothetical protein
MALGYQGMILLDGNLYLVTDGNLDHSRPEIVSEGTYAASSVNNAVGRVHVFDFDEVSGGFNCDTNIELINQLFDENNGWVTNRDTSYPLLWYSNVINNYEFGDAYWSRISLSAGAGNMLTTSFDVTMIPGTEEEEDDYDLPIRSLQLADDYIGQRFGLDDGGEGQLLPNVSFATGNDKQPIPYWETSINFLDENNDGLPEGIHVLNWSLEMSNNITKRNLCAAKSGTDNHPGPAFIQVGLASVTLNVTFVTVVTLDDPTNGNLVTDYVLPDRFNDVIINVGDKQISLGRLDDSTDGNKFSNPVQSISDANNLSGAGALQEMNYIAQGYFTMPHLKGT